MPGRRGAETSTISRVKCFEKFFVRILVVALNHVTSQPHVGTSFLHTDWTHMTSEVREGLQACAMPRAKGL